MKVEGQIADERAASRRLACLTALCRSALSQGISPSVHIQSTFEPTELLLATHVLRVCTVLPCPFFLTCVIFNAHHLDVLFAHARD